MDRSASFRPSARFGLALLLAGLAGGLVAVTVYWSLAARVADLLWLVSGFFSVASLSQLSSFGRMWPANAGRSEQATRPLGAGDVSIAYRLIRISVGDEEEDEGADEWVMVEYSASFAVLNESPMPSFVTLPFHFSREPGVVDWGRPRITALQVGDQMVSEREIEMHADRFAEGAVSSLLWPLSLGSNEALRVVLTATWLKRTASIEPWSFPLPVYGDVTIQIFAAPGLLVDVSAVSGGRVVHVNESPTGTIAMLNGPFPTGVSANLSWQERPRHSV